MKRIKKVIKPLSLSPENIKMLIKKAKSEQKRRDQYVSASRIVDDVLTYLRQGDKLDEILKEME